MDKEILVNPITAIRLFAQTYLTYGDEVFKDRKYKLTREAWITSMFLIARGQHEKSEWWLTPVLDSGSPDFNCYSFFHNNKSDFSIRSKLKLEVFEWRKEQNEPDFLEALKKIKLNKIIDPEITLVCYARIDGIIPPAVDLYPKIKKINPHIKDIWYLGDISGDASIWRVTEVFPDILAIDLNYDQILNTKETHSFIYAYRGKSDKLEFEHTGKKILLTPEFEIKELP